MEFRMLKSAIVFTAFHFYLLGNCYFLLTIPVQISDAFLKVIR